MGEVQSEDDSNKVKELEEFRKIEQEAFRVVKDQAKARNRYDEAVLRGLPYFYSFTGRDTERMEGLLARGTIVSRGGVFQEIGRNVKIDVAEIHRGWASSKKLPDGSIVDFPSDLIEAKGYRGGGFDALRTT